MPRRPRLRQQDILDEGHATSISPPWPRRNMRSPAIPEKRDTPVNGLYDDQAILRHGACTKSSLSLAAYPHKAPIRRDAADLSASRIAST